MSTVPQRQAHWPEERNQVTTLSSVSRVSVGWGLTHLDLTHETLKRLSHALSLSHTLSHSSSSGLWGAQDLSSLPRGHPDPVALHQACWL